MSFELLNSAWRCYLKCLPLDGALQRAQIKPLVNSIPPSQGMCGCLELYPCLSELCLVGYKIEHKVVENVNKLFASSNTGEMLLMNNVMLVITTITDIPLTRLGESLNLYESLFLIISYICMLSWNLWAYFFFHLLYTLSCLRKSPGAGSLLSTSLVWNVVSYPWDSHALRKSAQNELVKHHCCCCC